MTQLQTLQTAVIDRTRTRTIPGGVAALVLVGTLWWVAGALGAAAGLLIGVTWLALPAPYVVAVGHLVLLAVLETTPGVSGLTTLELVCFEAGVAGLLVGANGSLADQGRLWLWFVPVALVSAGLGWLVLDSAEALWLATLVVTTAVTLAAYAIHRYELARLDVWGERT